MISLLDLGRGAANDRLVGAIARAVELVCADAAAFRYSVTAAGPVRKKPGAIELSILARF